MRKGTLIGRTHTPPPHLYPRPLCLPWFRAPCRTFPQHYPGQQVKPSLRHVDQRMDHLVTSNNMVTRAATTGCVATMIPRSALQGNTDLEAMEDELNALNFSTSLL